jgi:hypothetical protein
MCGQRGWHWPQRRSAVNSKGVSPLELPMRVNIDPLVLQTFGRLAGIRALLELLDRALPDTAWHEHEALKAQAAEQDWEFGDFDVERQILDERFEFWLPRYTAYSVVTLLHTVLEAQLLASAERAHLQFKASFTPEDVRGRGIEAATLYLRRLGAFDARQDKAWPIICDLRDLRHLIVHRAGARGHSEQHRQIADRLEKAYEGRLEFPEGDSSWYGEVWISVQLCREFITAVETFFDRAFDSMGLPPRWQRRRTIGPG